MVWRPRVLISNDDGVTAPGLVSLARCLHAADCCDFSVCGPSGERSAQSHSISLHKELHAFGIEVEGAEEAFAVDGTPADSVMIALYSPLLTSAAKGFDLIISGINRGDNCGLHVIYSGTVGAAREGACKGVPALALSLDGFAARAPEQYDGAAELSVALIRALIAEGPDGALASLRGSLVNVNLPWRPDEAAPARGYRLARQGMHCHLPRFVEVTPPQGAAQAYVHMGSVTLRTFRNKIGSHQTDDSPGTDSWALSRGWVSVTPLSLSQDVPLSPEAAADRQDTALVSGLERVMGVAAAELGIECVGAAAEDTDGLEAGPVTISPWQ